MAGDEQKQKRGPYNNTGNLIKSLEKAKDEVVSDYYSLGINDFYKKWHLNSRSLGFLKEKWDIIDKLPRNVICYTQ